MAIFMLSHLFWSYIILTKLYFNPILRERENSPSILFVFFLNFIWNQYLSRLEKSGIFYFCFHRTYWKKHAKQAILVLF